RLPLLEARGRRRVVDERRPAWAHRLAQQAQARLRRRPATLAPIAVDAARHDVLPGRATAERTRDDVVEVQLGAQRLPAAVLTRELVPREDVEAAVADVTPGHAVEVLEHDHSWHAQAPAGRPDLLAAFRRETAPRIEVEGLVRVVHGQRAAGEDQREGATRGRDVDREVGSIQYEHTGIQHVRRSLIVKEALGS